MASELDTNVTGEPIVVYNPLNVPREDLVEADLSAKNSSMKTVSVSGPDGREVPAQVEDGKVIFLATTPSVGYAVYNIRSVSTPAPSSELKVSPSMMENARYRVAISADGDVDSIFDKSINKELLSGPMRLAISNDAPKNWPAWNMDFDQEQAPPRSFVSGAAKIRVVENGPARVAVEVSREGEGSRFNQIVRLSAGDAGNRVEFSEAIDWRTLSGNLKAVFPLAAANKLATYNWEVGTIQRPAAFDRQFEVASHHWIDQTDENGSYGATILTDVKNGSDKRDDKTLRLTLLRSPGEASEMKGDYTDELNQDWGHHDILFGIAGHAGDWRKEQTDWQAYRLSTPLIAFATVKHPGALGRKFSMVSIDQPNIRVLALKKAEQGDEVILRMVELDGKETPHVSIKFAGSLDAAREVNGQEQPTGAASIVDGLLQTSFKPYQPRTFAIRLGKSRVKEPGVQSQPLELQYDLTAASADDTPSTGGFDSKGDALPAEMLPTNLTLDGVNFKLARGGAGKPDALVTRGRTIHLPSGSFNKVYLLAASANGDQQVMIKVGDTAKNLTIEDWGGFVGQWDTRLWKPRPEEVTEGGGRSNTPEHQERLRKDWSFSANHAKWDLKNPGSPDWSPSYPNDYLGLRPGYIKPATIAWYASHHHTPEGLNEPYAYSYLFVYSLDLPADAKTITLPDNANIRIMAISVAKEEPAVIPAQPLSDRLSMTMMSDAIEKPGSPLP